MQILNIDLKSLVSKPLPVVAALLFAISATAFSVPSYAQTGFENADPETAHPLDGGAISNDEFRALAGAQLTAIAFMCNHYLMDKGEYPPTLYDLMDSGYWLAEIDNIFTGEPIEQIEFEPRPGDYVTNHSGTYMPDLAGSQMGPLAGGQAGSQSGGDSSGVQPAAPGGIQMPVVKRNVLRLDPNKIGPFEPGDLLFYSQKDSSLQMFIWKNGEVFVEHMQTSPYDNSITRHQIARRTHLTDDIILASAVFIEQVLPREYGKLQFARGEDPLLPRDLATLTWERREEIFSELHVYPRNPITQTMIEPVKAFRIGMIADLGGGLVPPVYCMEGGRLRTLKEMTDLKYLAANQNEVKRREIAFGVFK